MTGLRGINGNPAAPPYTHGPYEWDQEVTFTGGIGGANLPGNKYYVDRNAGSSGDGKTWGNAFLTIAEGIAALNTDYTAGRQVGALFIGEGWYSEVPVTLTASDCWIIGVAPGHHDSTVLYGSATAGGWNIGSDGPALTITGDNNTIMNLGLFTYDNEEPALRIGSSVGEGGAATTVTGTAVINCSFVRDVADGELYGIESFGADGTLIKGCFFSTSCKTAGIWIGTNGVINPVHTEIIGCRFVGTETGIINAASSHGTIVKDCYFIDDTTDRPDTITLPINNAGGLNLIAMWNFWEFSEANAITGGDHLMVENYQLAAT